MQRKRLLVTLTIAIIVSLPALPAEVIPAMKIVLNTADVPPDSTQDHTGISDGILTEAFRRIGIPMRIVNLPSERALINADEGTDDGNFVRIAEINKFYPNLIQVPEDLLKFEFVVFSKRRNFKPAGWDSLKPYNVGIVRGWKILEENIKGTKSLTEVKDERILFALLDSDKVDMVVHDRVQGLVLLKKLKYRDIHILRPPLAVRNMYLHLNRKHSRLIPMLTEAIRGMKRDGTYDHIVKEVLDAYLQGRR